MQCSEINLIVKLKTQKIRRVGWQIYHFIKQKQKQEEKRKDLQPEAHI